MIDPPLASFDAADFKKEFEEYKRAGRRIRLGTPQPLEVQQNVGTPKEKTPDLADRGSEFWEESRLRGDLYLPRAWRKHLSFGG